MQAALTTGRLPARSLRLARQGAEPRQSSVVRPASGIGTAPALSGGKPLLGVDQPLKRIAEYAASLGRRLSRIVGSVESERAHATS